MIETERQTQFLSLLERPYLEGGLLGEPYDQDEGCLKFVTRALSLIGIELTGDLRDDGRNWQCQWRVNDRIETLRFKKFQLGDVAVFQGLPFAKFHIALMLDNRHAIQSSSATNGVGRIDIMGQEWLWALREIYRHKSLLAN